MPATSHMSRGTFLSKWRSCEIIYIAIGLMVISHTVLWFDTGDCAVEMDHEAHKFCKKCVLYTTFSNMSTGWVIAMNS